MIIKQKQTLHHTLATLLLLVIGVSYIICFTIASCGIFIHETKHYNNLAHKYAKYLSGSLAPPVWNLQEKSINSICEAFMHSSEISYVKLYEPNNKILFNKSKTKSYSYSAKANITHDDEIIGVIELGLRYDILYSKIISLILISLSGIIIVGLILYYSTKYILKIILKSPLEQLSLSILQITEGNYDKENHSSSFLEFSNIISAFNNMANEIKKRETSLVEKQLEIKKSHDIILQFNTELEDKVALRTSELTDALNQLKTTQSRAIEYEKLASLGRMAGGIAHEINNPLTIIKGSILFLDDMLQNNTFNKEEAVYLTDKISKTVDRISTIIRGLLAVSRDASGESYADFNIYEAITDAVGLSSEKIKNSGIKLTLNFDEKFTKKICQGNRVQISQVFVNLLCNATDAIENLNDKWIIINGVSNDMTDIIQIIDSGPGIPIDIVNKMFEPFFTSKDVGKGTGLGLSISKTIIEHHGWILEYDSNCKNTCFLIKIANKINK